MAAERPAGGDSDPIDGGPAEIEYGGAVEVNSASKIPLSAPFDVDKHRGRVTVLLIALLCLLVSGHYIAILVMDWNGKSTESLNAAFNAALPIVSGLVSSVVTYYFAGGKKR
jgi:hypothetical protein